MKLVAHWWWFHSHGTINRSATWNKINTTNQNVNPIIFLSVWPSQFTCSYPVDTCVLIRLNLGLVWDLAWPQIRHLFSQRLELWRIWAQGRCYGSPLSSKGLQKLRRVRADWLPPVWEGAYSSTTHLCSSVYTHNLSVFLTQYKTWQLICQGIMWDKHKHKQKGLNVKNKNEYRV